MLPLTEPYPSLAPDLPGEVTIEDDDPNTSNWINHCIETGGIGLESGQSLDLIFGNPSSCGFAASTELMGVELIDEVTLKDVEDQPLQSVTSISVPASPASSDSSYHLATNSMPRHKRPSHKRAELKRRDKIKNRLDDLKAEVPSIAFKEKMSESAILSKAAEYAKHLKGDCERFSTEAGNLRREIESLSTEIHTFQELLPASGLTPETSDSTHTTMEQRLDNYVTKHTKDNWKFYIFNFFMRRMFKSFTKEVVTDSLSSFESSVSNWVNERLSLSSLRPQSLEILTDVCKETEIMSHPESLPQQALASIGLTKTGSHQPTISSAPPPDQMPTVIPRQLAAPTETTAASCRPDPAALCTSNAASNQPANARSPKLKSISPKDLGLMTPSRHSPVAPRTSSAEPYQPLRKRSPKSRSTSPKVPTAAAMKQESVQLAIGSESVNPSRNVPLVVVTQSPRQLPLARFSVCPQPLTIASQATIPEHQSATNILVNQQMPRNIVPTTPVSTAAHQPITSIFRHFANISQQAKGANITQLATSANITQLATSIGGSSLNFTSPVAAVAPTKASKEPGTKVAKISISGITGSTDCHLYDFDVTDIPLPDLPDTVLSSPQPSFSTSSPFSCLTSIETFPLTAGSPTLSPAQPTGSILTFSHSSLANQSPLANIANPPTINTFPSTTSFGS